MIPNTNTGSIYLFEGQLTENPNLTADNPSELPRKPSSHYPSNPIGEEIHTQTDSVTVQEGSVIEIPLAISTKHQYLIKPITITDILQGGTSNSPSPSSLDVSLSTNSTTSDRVEIKPIGHMISINDGIAGITPQTNTSSSLINLSNFRKDSRFQNIDGRGFSVVILDTGIDLDHPFFGPDSNGDGVADRIVYQYDFGDNDANASDISTYYGHGSNVSSIIGSSDSRYMGVAPGVNIIHLKIFKNNGSGDLSMIERALQWVVNNVDTYNIASVNMSVSDGGNYSTPQERYGLSNKMATLASRNVTVVSAAGNSFYSFNSVQGVSYPAADPNSLAIGAVYDANLGSQSSSSGAKAYSTSADRITAFSQRDRTLTSVFAPGSSIGGADWKGGTVWMSGTSQAAPHITGAVALAQQLAVQELGRRLTVLEIKNLLQSTGVTINDGDDEDDNVTNTGLNFKRVDMLALSEAIYNMVPHAPIVSLSPASISLLEGNSNTVNYNFTVNLNKVSDRAVTVYYSVNDGTATYANGNGDYLDSNGSITFNPGETTRNLVVRARGDNLPENDETFTVKLESANNATIDTLNWQGTATILNDDFPLVTISSATQGLVEGDSGQTAYTFTVSLDRSTPQTVTVGYRLEGGTATKNDNDFAGDDGLLTFNPGEISKTITVYIKGDTKVENDETFKVRLNSVSKGVIDPSGGESIATIFNDDIPTISITPATPSVNEGNSGSVAYSFTVTLDRPSNKTVSVDYATFDGTATTLDNDYVSNTNTLNFNPGQTSKTITVFVKGDTKVEANENFSIRLTQASNGTIDLQRDQATGVIIDDDRPIVSLTPTLLSVNETNNGTVAYTFSVNLDRPSNQVVTINYSTNDGTATRAGNDYVDNDGTLTFSAGQTSQTITVYVNGDTNIELDENFFVQLNSANNATIDPTRQESTVTLVNDDGSLASITPATLLFNEGHSGRVAYTYNVNLDRPSDRVVTINYSTNDGTATVADNDYVDNDGTLTFSAGQTSKTITVYVNGDTDIEANESFSVRLNSATNTAIDSSSQQSTGILINDDKPIASIAPATLSFEEGDNGKVAYTYSVNLDRPSTQIVTINYSTNDSTATVADNDYLDNDGTLTFNLGQTSQTITVYVNGDINNEIDERFIVRLNSSSNATIDTHNRQSTGLILNDDGPIVSLSPTTIRLNEGDAGTVTYNVTVNLDRVSDQVVTVNYSTNDGTATVADNDYLDNDGTLTFNPGQTSQTIAVTVKGDTAIETNESFIVRLNSSNHATINPSIRQSTATILNDDSPIASLSPTTIRLNEGNGGTVAYTFSVNLDRVSDEVVTVNYSTNDGTATVADNDYVDNDGILTFNAGQTSQTLTVYVKGDTTAEVNESFFVRLNSANYAAINASYQQATGVINNDDGPSVSLTPANLSFNEGNSGRGVYNFTVNLDRVSDQIVTVNYTTNDGTATLADNDYVDNDSLLTFNPGQTSQTIAVYVNGDTNLEVNESFTVQLNSASRAVLNPSSQQSIGLIVNDDMINPSGLVPLSSGISFHPMNEPMDLWTQVQQVTPFTAFEQATTLVA